MSSLRGAFWAMTFIVIIVSWQFIDSILQPLPFWVKFFGGFVTLLFLGCWLGILLITFNRKREN